jgi:hypothetical protein
MRAFSLSLSLFVYVCLLFIVSYLSFKFHVLFSFDTQRRHRYDTHRQELLVPVAGIIHVIDATK